MSTRIDANDFSNTNISKMSTNLTLPNLYLLTWCKNISMIKELGNMAQNVQMFMGICNPGLGSVQPESLVLHLHLLVPQPDDLSTARAGVLFFCLTTVKPILKTSKTIKNKMWKDMKRLKNILFFVVCGPKSQSVFMTATNQERSPSHAFQMPLPGWGHWV